MRPRPPRRPAYLTAVAALALACLGPSLSAKERRIETIDELIDAMEVMWDKVLNPDEILTMEGRTPEEVREIHPELYEKVRQNTKRWVEGWVRKSVPPPDPRSSQTQYLERAVGDVDSVLKAYFEKHDWPYRRLNVVFLRQRQLHDTVGAGLTFGLFIPYYPDAFFTSFNPSSPTHLVLTHESFHFNDRGPWKGRPLVEGIAESIARRLVARHGLTAQRQLVIYSTYEGEREVVGYLMARIVERSGRNEEEALDMLVGWYLTGNPDELLAIFGQTAWERVVRASRNARHWEPFARAVHEAIPPLGQLAPPPAPQDEPSAALPVVREDVGPRLLDRVVPDYPTISKQIRLTGRIIVALTVTAEGRTRLGDVKCHLDFERSVPSSCTPFVKAVRRAAAQWRYAPALLDNRPVEVGRRVAVDFDIVDGAGVITLSEPLGAGDGPLDSPVLIRAVRPLFPAEARKHEIAGFVVARAELEAGGAVLDPTIFRSQPDGLFDHAVLEAISQWRYRKEWRTFPRNRAVEFQIHFQHSPSCNRVATVPVLESDAEHVERAVVCAGEGLPFEIAR